MVNKPIRHSPSESASELVSHLSISHFVTYLGQLVTQPPNQVIQSLSHSITE